MARRLRTLLLRCYVRSREVYAWVSYGAVPHLDDLDGGVQHVVQVEDSGLELQLSRLDLRDVEDVVHLKAREKGLRARAPASIFEMSRMSFT